MSLLNGLKDATNITHTANGAVANRTTKSSIVDFFAQAGAMRSNSEKDIIILFNEAFYEDALITTKLAFYFRDIRQGQGERRLFRIIIKYLAQTKPEVILKNLENIVEFGRYDDLYELLDTPCQEKMLAMLKAQFEADLKSDTPSLLGKWLKSENASSKESKKIAIQIMQYFGLSPRAYRKSLSMLRNRINIVETEMSNKHFDKIDYSRVPSCANKKYHKAFWRNDEERYRAFIEKAIKGDDPKVKVNAKVLFPYEIVKSVLKNMTKNSMYFRSTRDPYSLDPKHDLSLNLLWKNLPDYVEGNDKNCLAVIDTSGSMTSDDFLPISAAIGLGIYFAEKSKGTFANHFISFSGKPVLHEIKGTDIATKVRSIFEKDEIANTNIKGVFDLILKVALQQNLSQDEIPDRIIIVSDMQFDHATDGINSDTKRLFDYIKETWKDSPYQFPKLVYWNVNASNKNTFPMTIDDQGVQFVSGCSPVIFKNLLKDQFMTPLQLAMDVINTERYDVIKI